MVLRVMRGVLTYQKADGGWHYVDEMRGGCRVELPEAQGDFGRLLGKLGSKVHGFCYSMLVKIVGRVHCRGT